MYSYNLCCLCVMYNMHVYICITMFYVYICVCYYHSILVYNYKLLYNSITIIIEKIII